MAFQLNKVVPWGRNLEEYIEMFGLTEAELGKKIISFGDGPASFNSELSKRGGSVLSIDPIYYFSREEIKNRIEETRHIVMKQMAENMENYNWNKIKNLEELENLRVSAMKKFLEDYEKGKKEGRYLCHELPEKIDLSDKTFDIGLSSHFLLLYKELGYEFHVQAINEMLRLCREVRIFPICDLDGNTTELTKQIIKYFEQDYKVSVEMVNYEFQKNGNKLLIIKT